MRRSPTPRSSRYVVALVALLAAGALAGCSEESPQASAAPSPTPTAPVTELLPDGPGDPVATASGPVDVAVPGWSHADVAFVQMMIPHHRQALEMAALAPSRASSDEVVALASRIDAAQAPEILLMAGWLDEEGVDVPQAGDDPALWDHGSHGHDGMVGMLSAAELADLADAEGTAFDRLFLTGMIRHHEGALEMASAVLRGGTNPRVLELAEDVNAGQAAEVVRMRALLDRLGWQGS